MAVFGKVTIPSPPDIEPPKPLEEQLLESHEAVAAFLGQTMEVWKERGWTEHTSSIKVTTETEMTTQGMPGLKVNLELVVFSKPDDNT